jgi:hypothetical protein
MATITKVLDFYELKDAGVYALSADGAALTYGSKIDVPGVMEIQISAGDTRQIKLSGDNKIRRLAGRELSRRVRVRHSAASFDLFAALTGGTAATGGTSPSSTSSFTQLGADEFPYFKVAGLIHKAKDNGTENGANGVLNYYKCKITAPPTVTAGADGYIWEWEAEAIPTEFDDKMWDVTAYETAASLA